MKPSNQPILSYYYEPKRPASIGRWVVVTRGNNVANLESVHTEAEARKAVGLEGGSTDSRYVPEGAA